MLNDPLANTLNNILNAQKIGRDNCTTKPVSNMIKRALTLMQDHRYLGKIEYIDDKKGGEAKINLIGNINKCGVIKPRFAVKKDGFEKFEKRFLPAKNFGIIIVSTSQGLMTHIDAKNKKIGGRLISFIY